MGDILIYTIWNMKFLSENEELKDFSKISAAECPTKHDNARLIECRFGFLNHLRHLFVNLILDVYFYS